MPYHGEKQKTMNSPKNSPKNSKRTASNFSPHPMFKDGKMVMAKTFAEHKRLEKMGYGHKK